LLELHRDKKEKKKSAKNKTTIISPIAPSASAFMISIRNVMVVIRSLFLGARAENKHDELSSL